MEFEHQHSPFCKAMMTGLFVGIMATLVCLFYNVFYRGETGFLPADMINVSSLIFAVNLVFWLIGILYYLFLRAFKKGSRVFIIVFALFTAFLIWKAEGVNRSADHQVNIAFRGLLLGIIIIMAIGTFLIPWLFQNKKFEEHVL